MMTTIHHGASLSFRPNCDVSPTDLCHIMYTSGSTGRPKGVMCAHESLVNYALNKTAAHSVDKTSRVLLSSSFTFDPCVGDLLSALGCGAVCCLPQQQTLLTTLNQTLQEQRITHICTTPAIWALVSPQFSFPHLRVVALGGDMMKQSIINCWANRVRLIRGLSLTN